MKKLAFPSVASLRASHAAESNELGEILRTAREAVGWQLPRMAKETGYSVPYLSKLETGGKPVRPWHIAAYDKALGGDEVRRRSLLIMGAGMLAPAMWAELDLPMGPPRQFGMADVAALEESAIYLTGLGLRHGGQAAVAATKGQLTYSIAVLDQSTMTDDVRLRVLGATSRFVDRTAWSLSDAGHQFRAGKVYDLAIEVSPDDVHRWMAIVNLANLRLELRDPKRALELLDQPAPSLPVVGFIVESARAHAHAFQGNAGAAFRHVALADEHHARVNLADLPEPIRPYSSGHEAHAHSSAGKVLTVLAQRGSKKAIPLAVQRLEAAIDAFGPERAHAVANCQGRLSDLVG